MRREVFVLPHASATRSALVAFLLLSKFSLLYLQIYPFAFHTLPSVLNYFKPVCPGSVEFQFILSLICYILF